MIKESLLDPLHLPSDAIEGYFVIYSIIVRPRIFPYISGNQETEMV